MADCQLAALGLYGYDAVFAVMDVNVETEALGSKLIYRHHDYPYVESHAFSTSSNLEAVSIPDPTRAGRMPEILDALTILRREAGNQALVVGCLLGPMTLATQLLGLEAALYAAIDDLGGFETLLDFSTRVLIQFGIAQIESGAHALLVFDPSASQAVVPPQFFQAVELPRLRQLFTALKEAGSPTGWLHIAGPISSVLPLLPETGADIINFDYCVDPSEVISKMPGICCNGNIKSLDFEESSADKVLDDSIRLRDLFADRGGFILSSGCEVPLRSRSENVAALVSAAHSRRG
jgi:uroporphyrinogen decarboxylase